MRGRRWASAETALLREADRRATLGDTDVAHLADALGRSEEAVRARLARLGLLLPRSPLLVRRCPRYTPEARRQHRSALMRRRLAEQGHPRGFAGRRHDAATRARLSTLARARRSTRPVLPAEWVYFLQEVGAVGPIKIGRSTNPTARQAELQQASPVRLCLLATVRGGHQLETELHRRFAPARLHGEWFSTTAELLACIGEAHRG